MITLSRFSGMLVLLGIATTSLAESWRLTVEGRGTGRYDTPVVTELKTSMPAGNYAIQTSKGGKPLSAQVFEDQGKKHLGVILPPGSGSTRESYTLVRNEKSELVPQAVELRRAGPNIDVLVGGQLLTTYHTDFPFKPFYYPLVGPTGLEVTRAFPMKLVEGEKRDHPHQRSFWFTHGNVNGYDFWASDPLNRSNPKFGMIKETAQKTLVSGQALALIRTTDDWLGPDGTKVCSDERVFRFYNTGGVRILDADVTVQASNGPVTFGDTKEGMFGVRVASSMDVNRKTGGKITNAEGLTDEAAWGKPSAWVDYTGLVQDQTLGIAILNRPDSFRAPTTWHVRTYGLFAANPFGYHDYGQKESGAHTIPAGSSITFHYRMILHSGPTAEADLPAALQAYAEPPTITVERE
jgi:hypothetical protein